MDELEASNIKLHEKCQLVLRPDYTEKVALSRLRGEDQLWSSSFFNQHLRLLDATVPRMNESSARSRTEAFFFRVSAMVDPDQQMVLNPENCVPQTVVDPTAGTTFPGIINYTAFLTRKSGADKLPTFRDVGTEMSSTFIVAAAKVESVYLVDHLPEAISRMYACLKNVDKPFLRGALTNGTD